MRTDAPVERILVRDGRAAVSRCANGEELRAATVVAATHPQITFLRQIDRARAPGRLRRATSKHWRSRSGVVKVNVALSELPDFIADPGTELHERHTGAVELCHSIDYLERAFQRRARRTRRARARSPTACIPSTLDPLDRAPRART